MTGSGNNIEEQSITDEKGMYEFKDLEPGTYTIFFQSLKGFKSTAKDFFADDNLDSDADGVSLQTTPFVVISGQIINSIDAGFYRPASISGYAWNDVNQNGIQNKGESPMSNIAINITGNTGDSKTFAQSTTTDVNGNYIFNQLDPGFYNIKFTRPISHQTSPKDTGTDDTKDSDVLTDEIAEIIIGSGESRKFDVGFYKPVELGSIRGLIYNDLNRNGLNDDNSFVFQNQVSLLDSADNVLMETQTDAKGIYTFENLIGGKYQVIIKASRGKKITSSNNIDLDLTQSIENLSRFNPDAIVETKTIIVIVNTSRPPKHPTRDVQLMEVGIAPLDIICEPVCIPFFVNKTKKK